ncbi:hypothetical protein ACWDSD_41155 [Streptomyces spiralis]
MTAGVGDIERGVRADRRGAHITGGKGQPVTVEDLQDFVATFRHCEFDEAEPPANEDGADLTALPSEEGLPRANASEHTPADTGARPVKERRIPG